MSYRVTKTYGAELGLSASFRQWNAQSHCRFIHGYALGFKVVFEARTLDANGWVKDFGGLKPLKQRLIDTFDHKLLVAADDPAREALEALGHHQSTWPMRAVTVPQLADVLVVDHIGCESFARMVWDWADYLITPTERERGVRLVEVECREHAGNAASYMGENR